MSTRHVRTWWWGRRKCRSKIRGCYCRWNQQQFGGCAHTFPALNDSAKDKDSRR